ncbi:folylpolyglutamate synthase/dihydrofolate synthase family protein [Telluribacter sp.]|jgi:dihydrofolate synthase/folylpolyglutamate synthase|uniref:bifunctional folylpolyglutamate synthase/dihydrofolate synthase n=1 Tax=Telluribacter sp. TaxID=1978767 RepID=UPI002E12B3AA|nr:folylpolyglutamate synthase/dihydrofolate synthase family protein [Telluribacter sp.]
MTYQEAIEYLYNRLPIFQNQGARAYKPGLRTTYEFCERLGNPQQQYRTIHVAGTNGKGSTSHMLAAVLQKAGYRTGLYTSPHLKSFTERIRVNGIPVDEGFIVNFVSEQQGFIETVKPSFFEVTVAMAFEYFAQMKVDVAVIEVGMGGRLDSTNVIFPELSLITNISFDHMQYLGNTLPEIAREKAGIIKPEVPVVVSEKQEDSVAQVFEDTCLRLQAHLSFADEVLEVAEWQYLNGKLRVQIRDKTRNTIRYPDLDLDLSGSYQLKNIIGVLAAIDILRLKGFNLPDGAVKEGLGNTSSLTGLRGRWQVLAESPLVICDTAHNVAGLTTALAQLSTMPVNHKRFVIGFVADKDVPAILDLFPREATYYFCAPSNLRALEASRLAYMANAIGLRGEAFQDVNTALSAALNESSADDVIYVGGSTFVVADINQL